MYRLIDNARMRWKFLGCVGLVLVLLTAVAGFALHQLSVIDEQAGVVTAHDVPTMRSLAGIDAELADYEVTVLRHVAAPADARAAIDDRRTEVAADVDRHLADAARTFGDQLPAAWPEVTAAWASLTDAADRVVALSAAGQADEADALLEAELDPQVAALHVAVEALLVDQEAEVVHEGEMIHREHDQARLLLLVALGLALTVGMASSWLVSRRIVQRLGRTVAAVRLLGEGDLRARPEVDGTDELGEMADSLGRALARTHGVVVEMSGQAQTLAAAAEELSAVSSQLASSSAETTAQATSVAANADRIAEGMNSVASGTEELAATIREISSGAHASASVSADAVDAAERARQTMAELARSSDEISQVVQLIAGVAEQTNLLALNATIEAARAGEAGRGFAVVAGEVKELARQTASATSDISQRVQAIQAASAMAAEAIDGIGRIIGSVQESSSGIAAAVEEQTATTQEITKYVHSAADGTASINAGLEEFARAADDTTQAASTVQVASSELAGLSSALQQLVGQFRV